jgi:formate/nitrite transporter FocA (FNT family)
MGGGVAGSEAARLSGASKTSGKKGDGPPAERAESGAPAAGWAVADRFSWDEIHQRLLAGADEEIASGGRELFFSGFTAGIAITLTFLGHAVGLARFPDNAFLSSILFPLGFVYIILGRYQLYTENTLPPVKLVLTRMASLPLLFRVWGIVLAANIAGAAFGGFLLATTGVMPPAALEAGAGFAAHGVATPWWDAFFKAVFAGWLVAGVVWLGYAARDATARLLMVYFVFYAIAVLDLFHVVTAAADVSFALFRPAGPPLGAMIGGFWLPVLLGNTAGGVLVFALVSYAQSPKRRFPEVRELTLREVFMSWKGGRGVEGESPLEDD